MPETITKKEMTDIKKERNFLKNTGAQENNCRYLDIQFRNSMKNSKK